LDSVTVGEMARNADDLNAVFDNPGPKERGRRK
jgi:hypothetical protein